MKKDSVLKSKSNIESKKTKTTGINADVKDSPGEEKPEKVLKRKSTIVKRSNHKFFNSNSRKQKIKK